MTPRLSEIAKARRLAIVSLLTLAGVTPTPAGAGTNTDYPVLGAVNVFSATGSRQSLLRLEERALLRTSKIPGSITYLPDHLLDNGNAPRPDVNTRSTGAAAAFLIKQVGANPSVQTAFVTMKGQCQRADAMVCEPYEWDVDLGTERDPSGWYFEPVYVLPAGLYAVTILADPGAATTSVLELEGPSGSQELPLTQPTEATFEYRLIESLHSTGFEGSFHGSLSREGKVTGGVRAGWRAALPEPAAPTPSTDITLKWPGDSMRFVNAWPNAALGGSMASHPLSPSSMPGEVSVDYSWQGHAADLRGAAFLLTSPDIPEPGS